MFRLLTLLVRLTTGLLRSRRDLLLENLALRLIEADYLLTSFDNSSNNHQNNVRLGAGLIF